MASVINTEDFGTYIISKMYVIINRFVLVYLQFIWMFSYYCWQTSSLACPYLEEQLTCFQLSLSASFWLNAFCITVEVNHSAQVHSGLEFQGINTPRSSSLLLTLRSWCRSPPAPSPYTLSWLFHKWLAFEFLFIF